MSISGLPFVTLSEASEVVGLTTGRLRQLLRAGEIKGMKAGPRAWLIPEKEVLKLKKRLQDNGRLHVAQK